MHLNRTYVSVALVCSAFYKMKLLAIFLGTILSVRASFPKDLKQVQNKDVDVGCILLHCGLQSTACFADLNCDKVLTCMGACSGQEDEAACQFVCQWEFGRNNEHYLNLLSCMGENHCLSMQPDGICLGDASDATDELMTMEEIEGDWWILKGQNCGQDEVWNGGYDAYPCQLESYIKDPANENGWVRNTTYCTGKNGECTSPYINVMPKASIESNGVVLTTYDDPLYLDMEERWFVVERVETDWMFYFWCSENLAASDNGAVILGRARSLEGIPESVVARFKELTSEYGLDYDAMCVNDNTGCPY